MKRKMTAAIIGIGYIGKEHLAVLKEKVSRIIICDPNEKESSAFAKLNGCAFYADYKQMLERETPDFACVCVPTPLHARITVDLLKHGVNVLCEKPFATEKEDARRMIDTAQSTKKLLMVGHCVRFSPYYEYLRKCFADERFGKPKYVKLFRHSKAPAWSAGNWLQDIKKSGGVVMDLHIHDTDFIRSLLGIPRSVNTSGYHASCTTAYDYGKNVCVTADATWRQVSGFDFISGYDVVFENAAVQYENGKIAVYYNGQSYDPMKTEEFPSYIEGDNIYNNEIEYFIQCLEKNEKPLVCPPEESYDSLSINLAEIRSLVNGRREDTSPSSSPCGI